MIFIAFLSLYCIWIDWFELVGGPPGRDGLTHNMLELVHSHWKRRRVCKVRCKGVPTVDMDNVCRHLEVLVFFSVSVVMLCNISLSILLWTLQVISAWYYAYCFILMLGKNWRKDHSPSWWRGLSFSWQKLQLPNSSAIPGNALETSCSGLPKTYSRSSWRIDKSSSRWISEEREESSADM